VDIPVQRECRSEAAGNEGGWGMTQEDKIFLHLLNKGPITPMEAFQEYGIMRLSARIYELKKAGHRIESATIKVKNRFGEDCRVSKYYLRKY
jgi:hypothetical protein